MSSAVEMAFRPDTCIVPVDKILPLRKLPADIESTKKYQRILASLREVGLIEPLVVFPKKGSAKQYILLDGTIRLHALKSIGVSEILCLVATVDETYTYNQKINQMTPIQEHFMILKAIKSGVPEERIAKTLNVDVSRIRQKQHLLNGICPEVVALIKDRRISANTIREVKRVKPMWQLEMIELMIAANNFSVSYAKYLYAAAPEKEKLESDRPHDNHGFKPEETARMQGELERLTRNLKLLQDGHSENILHLVPILGYVQGLLSNAKVVRFLGQQFPDILTGFQQIVKHPELDAA